jgi:aquaporin Z
MTATTAATVTAVRSPLSARIAAETAGTFILVFGVVGAALFNAGFDNGAGGLNVGFLGVALALGLSVLVAASSLGPVSGGHFNPAVTLGLALARRFSWRDVLPYVAAQVVGGLVASTFLLLIASGGAHSFASKAVKSGFASTGWGQLSPGGFALPSAFLVETITTCVFVWVVLGVTGSRGNSTVAPIAIGLTLTLVALIAIPVSNGSFNPARSIATAVYGGPTAWAQLWMSIVAPLLGGTIAGLTRYALFDRVRS